MSQRFFLYARKSSDVEDKQVLSIEAQLTELRAFAKRENLQISCEFIEKQSAKIPGRPFFNNMLSRLEASEADGIVSWHPFMPTPPLWITSDSFFVRVEKVFFQRTWVSVS